MRFPVRVSVGSIHYSRHYLLLFGDDCLFTYVVPTLHAMSVEPLSAIAQALVGIDRRIGRLTGVLGVRRQK